MGFYGLEVQDCELRQTSLVWRGEDLAHNLSGNKMACFATIHWEKITKAKRAGPRPTRFVIFGDEGGLIIWRLPSSLRHQQF